MFWGKKHVALQISTNDMIVFYGTTKDHCSYNFRHRYGSGCTDKSGMFLSAIQEYKHYSSVKVEGELANEFLNYVDGEGQPGNCAVYP